MDADDAAEDDGPMLPWVPPDDRLWRHPSEVGAHMVRRPSSPPRASRTATTRTWSVAVVAGVVGAIIASGVGVATGNFNRRTTVVQPVLRTMAPTTMALTASSMASPDWPAVADAVSPSVVSITTNGDSGTQTGSGVLYLSADRRSYILTAASLLDDGRIQVTFDDSQAQEARVVGIDRRTGLALVSVTATSSASTFPTFESEADLRLAEPVMTVGARTSAGDPVTSGSISGLDQAIDASDGSTMEGLVSIADGDPSTQDAGGALVDAQGAVFGIEASVDSPDADAQGQSYAVPMDIARHVASQMLAGQRVTHPWIGIVDTTDPSTATARSLSLTGGAQVTEVAPASPAQAVGMTPSDVITGFNGQTVSSTGNLNRLVDDCQPGDRANISYLHDGHPITANISVAETPVDVALG